MRTLVKLGLVSLTFASMALACGNDRPATQPTPGAPRDPLATNDHNPPQEPINTPIPQSPTFDTAGPQRPITDPSPQPSTFSAGQSTSTTTTTSATGVDPTSDKSPLSDAEVLDVAETANNGEVAMAELAIKRASSPEVKQYAAMLKMHHSAAAAKGKSIETQTKIAPADNAVSTLLKSDTDSTLKDLRSKQGKAFDRAYIDAQVKAHKEVLTAIDNRLLPSAKNSEVKTMITEMRQTVSNHLAKADELAKKSK